MRNLLILLGLTVAIGSLGGCTRKKEAVHPPAAESAPAAQKVPFTPPSDSVITRARLIAWLACNPLLDSLGIMFQDSFKVDDAGVKLRRQADFVQAQDMICVRAGLPGGYDEYVWTRKAMSAARNKPLLDSLHVGVY